MSTPVAAAQRAPVPMVVVGGYLGAGKTTLLNRLLERADGLRVAVLAEKKVLVSGPPREVAEFKHPFIEHFFQGERGRRAMSTV